MPRWPAGLACAVLCAAWPNGAAAQGVVTPPPAAAVSTPQPQSAADDDTIRAGDEEPARQLVKWNDYRGPYFTLRLGGGVLYEAAGYSQDEDSRQQFDLPPANKVRDARLTLKGTLPRFRQLTFSAGFMYDGPTDSWLVRETGVMFAVPKLWGHLFIGRTKEGFSLNKVMVGYSGWTIERSTMNDASIPILADGLKWLGYAPNHRWLWNVGFYGDWLSKEQSFSTYHRQFVTRLAFLPIHSERDGTLLHLGANYRYGIPEDERLRFRSRPEAFPAPYFVDTGSIAAISTRMLGYEAYYRHRRWLVGSEYWFTKVNSRRDDEPAQPGDDPVMHGGDVMVSWLATGETRGYNTVGGFFKSVSPARPVFEGGPGAWEIVFRASRIDLDAGPSPGGRFWRITPMVNWHLTDNARLAFVYGYGRLHRFDLKGNTHFFQSRLQLLL